MIVSDQSLLFAGVEELLRSETALDVFCCLANTEQAMQYVHEFMPKVVIVQDDNTQVDRASLFARILETEEGGRVIGLNLEESYARI